jgi:tRNA dimethylallyltransferase
MHPPPRKDILLVLSGPTASGKTELACDIIAHQLPVEIISADSRQIYKFLTIGTAKPDPATLQTVHHHFVNLLYPDEPWNAGMFASHSRELIPKIFRSGKIPFVVGGTGLYFQALIDGIIDVPAVDPEIRKELEDTLDKDGLAILIRELEHKDPETASRIDLRNPRRVIRALEIFRQAGYSGAEIRKKTVPLEYTVLWFGLNWDRKRLYRRIDQRVDNMLDRGLVNEVTNIKERGYDRSLNALQTVGYTEVFDFLEKKISDTEMVRLIKRNSRRFAKRQLTWFRREKRIRWIEINDPADITYAANLIVSEYKKASGFSL